MADPLRASNAFVEFFDAYGKTAGKTSAAPTPSGASPVQRASGFEEFFQAYEGKTAPTAQPSSAPAPTSTPSDSPDGFFTRLYKAGTLGSAQATLQTSRFFREAGQVLERELGPVRDSLRTSLGLPTDETNTETIISELSQPTFQETEAQKTITSLQGFRTMQTDDVKGVLSGVNYALEQAATSLPQMVPMMAAGGMGLIAEVGMQAGIANSELAARVPELSQEDRIAVSLGAGTMMASLDILGMGYIFGSLSPSAVAEKAAMKQLARYLEKQGVGPAIARTVQTAIVEGSTESLQEAIQMASVELSGGQIQPGEVPSRLREAFFGGMAGGAVIGTPAAILHQPKDETPVGKTAEEIGAALNLEAVDNKALGTDDDPEGNEVLDTATAAELPGAATAVQHVTPETPEGSPAPDAPTLSPTNTLNISGSEPSPASPMPDALEGEILEPDLTIPSTDELDSLSAVIDPVAAKYGFDEQAISNSPRLQMLLGHMKNAVMSANFKSGAYTTQDLSRITDALIEIGAPEELTHYIGQRLATGSNLPFSKTKLPQISKLVSEIQAYEGLRAELDKLGLQNLGFVFAQPDEIKAAHGIYDVIHAAVAVRLDRDTPVTIGHEALHALKALGVFNTPKGAEIWNVLSAYAATMPDTAVVGSYRPEQILEEKIAELYGQYNNVRNSKIAARRTGMPDIVQEALAILRKGFEVVKNWVNRFQHLGRKIRDPIKEPWDALEYIASGKIKSQTMEAIGGLTYDELKKVSMGVLKAGNAVNLPRQSMINARKMKQGADYYTFIVKWGWNVIQLAKKNPHIQWLQEYVQQANRWYNEKMAWLSRANETVALWNNLSLNEQRKLSEFVFEIEQMGYRTPQEVQAGIVRKPTKAELAALWRKYGLSTRKDGPFAVFMKMRSDFDAVLDKLEALAIRDVQRTLASNPVAVLIETAKVRQEFQNLRKRPYFPHARFGNFTAVVTDAKGKTVYVESFESERERNKAIPSIKKMFPNDSVGASYIPEEAQPFKGLPPSILMSLRHNLKLSPTQEQAMDQLILQWSPTQSFKNHFVRRENIPGYSRDALRAYADYFWHGANHIARLEFGPLLNDAIEAGKANASVMRKSGRDSTKRMQMVEFLSHHFDNIMNPKPDWNMVRSLGFLWYLGYNIKSAIVNLTQVPLVTVPFLSAHFGDFRVAPVMAKTYLKVRKLYSSPKKAAHLYSPLEMKALDQAFKEGITDESQAMQLAGVAEGGNLLRTRTGGIMHKAMLKFNASAAAMFQVAEKINRKVTFLAALDLAVRNPNAKYLKQIQSTYNLELQDLIQKQGWTIEEATAYLAGKDAVRSTQFEYSSWARPRFMEGWKSAFFVFFMFQQNMMWFIQNSPGSTRFLLTLLGTAGLMGLPLFIGGVPIGGSDDWIEFIKWLGRRFDKHWDLEKEARAFITELTDMPPDIFLHGASRYGFGLEHLGDMTGLPLPAVDLSGNLGMGSPVPIVSPTMQALGRQGDFNDKLSMITQEGVGAGFGIGLSIIKALSDENTNPRRLDQMLPTAVANISKAYRHWKEGEETRRGGAQLIPYERNNPEQMAELAAQAMGFRLTRSAQAWDLAIAEMEASDFWTSRRGMLLDQMDLARRSGQKEDVADVVQAIVRYNNQVPFKELRISKDTLSRSAKQRELARTRREAHIPDAKMMTGVYGELQRLHPEVGRVNVGEEPAPSFGPSQ